MGAVPIIPNSYQAVNNLSTETGNDDGTHCWPWQQLILLASYL